MLVITNSERNYIVYCHVFPTGKTLKECKKYFGITCQGYKNRWGKGGSGYKGQLVYNAIEKYGWYNTKHYILFKNLTKEEAEQKEIELIAKYNTTDRRYGYNVAKGGQGGLVGANNPGSIKVVCVNTGEVFDTINDAAIKYNLCDRCISACCKGTRNTTGNHPDTGERMVWQYYDEWLVEPKEYNKSIKRKKSDERCVICVETGVIYDSVTEAANSVGLHRTTVGDVCRGKNNTAGGYRWAYYNEYIKDPDKYNKPIKQNKRTRNDKRFKKVLCIETNVIYNNCSEAADSIGVNRTTVGKVCRGENKTAGGYHWKYID